LLGKPEGRRPFRKPNHRRENDIIKGLRAVGHKGVDLNLVANDGNQWRALVYTVMNLNFHKTLEIS
jgi:hypothetical protein